jgi:ApaG protein
VYSEVSNQIKVSVEPQFLGEQSEPKRGVYAFAYKVNIENHGLATVQLLRRHWMVTSGGTAFTEVEGEGVIGEQPVLQPGQTFSYTSWSVIKDPVGSMNGEYTFVAENGDLLEVRIPEFDLVYPESLH